MRDVRGNALRKGGRSEVASGNTVQKTNRTRPDQTVLRWSTALSAYCNDQFVHVGVLILHAEARSRHCHVSHEGVGLSLTAVGFRQRLRGRGLAARAAVAVLSRKQVSAPSFRMHDPARAKKERSD
jgi:hypothetical protein